jgi:hypothetical protein
VTVGPAVPAATSGSSGARRGLPGGAWARAADGGSLLGSVLKAFPLLEGRTSSQGLETPGVAGSPVYRAPAGVWGTSNSKSRLCVRPSFRREQPRARPAISWRRISEQAPGLAGVRLFWRDQDGQDGSGQISRNHGAFGSPPVAVVVGGASESRQLSKRGHARSGLARGSRPVKTRSNRPFCPPGSAATPGNLPHSRRAAPAWPCAVCARSARPPCPPRAGQRGWSSICVSPSWG